MPLRLLRRNFAAIRAPDKLVSKRKNDPADDRQRARVGHPKLRENEARQAAFRPAKRDRHKLNRTHQARPKHGKGKEPRLTTTGETAKKARNSNNANTGVGPMETPVPEVTAYGYRA